MNKASNLCTAPGQKKHSQLHKLVIIGFACTLLAACATTTKLKIDYRSANTQAPLEVPPDLDKLPSDASDTGTDTFSGYAAERAAAHSRSGALLPSFNNMQIERDGDIRWLRIKAGKNELWIDLKNFLGDLGLVIETDNPATGIIETGWAENRAKLAHGGGFFGSIFSKLDSTGEMDRYRVRLEQDTPGWYAVYISHQGLVEKVASGGGDSVLQTTWQRRPSDPELEAEMLRLLLVYLGVEDKKASGLMASGIRKAQAVLATEARSDNKYIVVKLPYGRAQRRLEATLDRLGAKVIKSDNGGSLLQVSYLLPKEEEINKSGFFGRLLRGGKKKPYTYYVQVTDKDSQTEIRLRDQRGAADTSERAGEFLKILFEGLK